MYAAAGSAQDRPRAREVGVTPGVLDPGSLNAITDVDGVLVGQITVSEGERVRSGVTVVVPHPGNVFADKLPAAIHVGNGFGKLTGVTQVRELGEIETPIALTCTLCVPNAANALITHAIGHPDNADVRSVNPVVGETNDGLLSDIRSRPVREEHVLEALRAARGGPVEEGAVGAGTGSVAFGWKAGIGTSSRRLPAAQGGWTIGVLVQSNFGGILHVLGVPVGRELAPRGSAAGSAAGAWSSSRSEGDPPGSAGVAGEPESQAVGAADSALGSIVVVIATDAPLDPRNLERLAARAMLGVGRTGSWMANGSGDYAIAFSTAPGARRIPERRAALTTTVETVPNDRVSPLFQAVAEATEEAVYNSLFRAATTRGNGHIVEALPIERVLEILREHGIETRPPP